MLYLSPFACNIIVERVVAFAQCVSYLLHHRGLFSFLFTNFNFSFFVTESRRASIDVFLKAAGYLDCAVRHVLPHLSAELRFILMKTYMVTT